MFFEIQTAAFMVHPQSIRIAMAMDRARAVAGRGSTAIGDTLLRYSCCDLYFHAKLAPSIFTSSEIHILHIILHPEYNVCDIYVFPLLFFARNPTPPFPQDPLAGEKRERMSRQRRESRVRVGVVMLGKGRREREPPAPVPLPSLPT